MKMKNSILITGSILLMSLSGIAQVNEKYGLINIQTSAQCEMCKTRIEETLAFEKGVKTSELDMESKIVKVIYNPDKTTPGKIRKAISLAGYDADDIPADQKAYNKLPACCKKPEKE